MKSITLTELLIVVIVLGILAAVSVPGYFKTREHAYGNDAKMQLTLIAAAQRGYRMEGSGYYPLSGAETSIANINSNLSLAIPVNSNWEFNITGGNTSFTASASRKGTGGDNNYFDCEYTWNASTEKADPNSYCP